MLKSWGRDKAVTAEAKCPAWDADWVVCQEGSPSACQAVARRLAELIEGLTEMCCARPVLPSHPRYDAYLERLWMCIEHHWRLACAESPLRLAQLLPRLCGDGTAAGTFKGNLPAEVLLAQALEFGDERAAQCFDGQYMPVVRAIARRAGGEQAVDGVENFAAELVLPRAGSPPRIATFRGAPRSPTGWCPWCRTIGGPNCGGGGSCPWNRNPKAPLLPLPSQGSIALVERCCNRFLSPVPRPWPAKTAC